MNIAALIDHTLLKTDCTPEEIENLCLEADEQQFAAVCIPPYFVKDAVAHLRDSVVKVATVIGFPMGYSATPAKVEEVKRAIDEGVDEIDMVINLCAVKQANWAYVRNDIDSVTRATHLKGKVIKVILATDIINQEELEKLCAICAEIGVDYVKTSTDSSRGGATIAAVAALRKLLPEQIKIKASGGIKERAMAEAMLEAGAGRIGTSSSLHIIGL